MQYVETVLPILRELRGILLPHWGTAAVREKPDARKSAVTDLDIAAEQHAKERLLAAYPDIAFVGEETGGDRGASRFWLMDPLDGTKQYVAGEEGCTSMLALIGENRVHFAAVYDFLHDVMYWASEGRGAYRDSERIRVSACSQLADARVICEANRALAGNQEIIDALSKRVRLERSTLAGIEFAQLASGECDARICFDAFGFDYDYAPGALIVAEAGGVITNIGDAAYDYRNTDFVAANPLIHAQLSATLLELRAKHKMQYGATLHEPHRS